MDREIFTKEKLRKLKIFFYMVIYDLLCEIVFLILAGADLDFPIGLAAGTLTAMFNFLVMEKVVDYIIEGKKMQFAFLFHLGRFLIFGLAGYFCFMISTTALLSYGVGVLGLAVAAAAAYGRG